jgi:hypothetical protein
MSALLLLLGLVACADAPGRTAEPAAHSLPRSAYYLLAPSVEATTPCTFLVVTSLAEERDLTRVLFQGPQEERLVLTSVDVPPQGLSVHRIALDSGPWWLQLCRASELKMSSSEAGQPVTVVEKLQAKSYQVKARLVTFGGSSPWLATTTRDTGFASRMAGATDARGVRLLPRAEITRDGLAALMLAKSVADSPAVTPLSPYESLLSIAAAALGGDGQTASCAPPQPPQGSTRGDILQAGPALDFAKKFGSVSAAAPLLGADADELLRSCGDWPALR